MERVTISLEEPLLAEFDAHMQRKGYRNRSEAIRDLVRTCLEEERVEQDRAAPAVGCLCYVFNHHQRDLARRLTEAQHNHHGLVLSTLHVHLDDDNCMEVAVLHGGTAEVQQFSEETIAETGVRHGRLFLVPTALAARAGTPDKTPGRHTHPDGTTHADHSPPSHGKPAA